MFFLFRSIVLFNRNSFADQGAIPGGQDLKRGNQVPISKNQALNVKIESVQEKFLTG